MKYGYSALSLLVCISVSWAQERVPQENVDRIAKLLAEHTAKLDNAQVKVDVDADKAYGFQAKERVALIIPDKKLTEEAIGKAGKEATPIGQLWFRGLAPVVDGKSTPNDKLRIMMITINNKEHALPLCLVGVRKDAKGALELVLYGKDKEPLLSAPLKKVDARQEMPIELEGKGEGDTGTLTINLLGKYQAMLPVGKQE